LLQSEPKFCREKIDSKAGAGPLEDFESLQEDLKEVITLMKEFKEERRTSSKLFGFWDEYGTMDEILLQFIKVERTGNWKAHLSAAVAMTPHSMDKQNYSRWLPSLFSRHAVLREQTSYSL